MCGCLLISNIVSTSVAYVFFANQLVYALRYRPVFPVFRVRTCFRSHDFGDGPGSAPCDLNSVAPVLASMIDAKIDYLWSVGKVFDARTFAALKPWLMRGLPTLPGEKTEVGEDAVGRGLAAARKLFRWRDDATEAAETSRSGVGILFWCSMHDDVDAVLELAKAARDGSDGGSDNESNNTLKVHRHDVFGFFVKGNTALSVAVTFASWPVVEAILEMGANPTAVTITGWDPLMLMSLVGRATNITRWCERFPAWDFSRRATSVGVTVLGVAILFGPNKVESVKALIHAGADPLVYTAHTGTTVLHNAAANRDADAELVRYVLGLDGVLALINTPMLGRKLAWKLKFLAARLLVKLGSKKAILNNVSEWPLQTPLITAARNGNAAVIKVLVEEGGADTESRNARGRAAIDVLVGGENALEECRRLLRLG